MDWFLYDNDLRHERVRFSFFNAHDKTLVYSNILYALKGVDTIGTSGSNNVVTTLIFVSLTISN